MHTDPHVRTKVPAKVIVKRVVSLKDIDETLRFSVTQLNELKNLELSHNIVIKPNLCCDKSPASGATTDVELIDSIVKLINETNPSAVVSIVESNNHFMDANRAFQLLGYSELRRKYSNVKLVNLSLEKRYWVEINGCIFANLMVPETLLKMDYFISVAKLKTHAFERMSGIIKNQFGCLITISKADFHPFMSEALTDLNSIYKPHLCVVDGRLAMEGFGPVNGTPVQTDLLIIGNDPVATDAVAARIMGFSPKSVPHLKYAAKLGLGQMKNVSLVGDANIGFDFKFIPSLTYIAVRLLLRFKRYHQYICNLGNFIQKTRSENQKIGVINISKRVTLSFALRNVMNWIFRKDG